MQNTKQSTDSTAMTSHIARLLILSYFVALGTGAIEGADLTQLTRPFLGQPQASYFMGVVVLLLAFMIFTGMFRRPAALILSLVLFWSSYLTLYSGGDLTGFWRDLALIGGLCMTAGVGDGFVFVHKDTSASEPEPIEPLQAVSQRPLADRSGPRPTKTRFQEDLERAREA